ncbi:MAG: serine hydrolase [Myxococcales bacterium]|nr:serine hydrolase [Myxococcales bacterium]
MTRLPSALLVSGLALGLSACGAGPMALHRLAGSTFVPRPPREPPPLELAAEASPAERDRFVDAAIERMLEHTGATGAAVVVVRDGSIAHAHGFGRTDDGGVAVTADTPFRIGSVGKLFTALAAVRLASAGQLDLDAPVRSLVPELAALDARVTTRTLLSHTAGVPDAGGCAPGLDAPTDYARAHADDPLWAPPGAFFNYSNAGMTFAGAVLEATTGEPFGTVVEREVFRRAAMESATYDPEAARARGAAIAHRVDGSHADDEPPCGLIRAAGGAFVSARDLGRFAIAMMDDTLLDDAGRAAMLSPATDLLGDGREAYGLGVFLRDHGGRRVAYHPGGMQGWSAILAWMPEQRFALAFVVNAPAPIPARFLDVYFPRSPEAVAADRPSPPDPATLRSYAGTYTDPHGMLGRLRVEVDGDHLRLVPLGGQVAWPLFVTPTFWPDERGRVRYLATRLGVAVRE